MCNYLCRDERGRCGRRGEKYWLSIAAFVLVFIAVVVTSNRIVAQANQYVSDATAQSCVLVSTLMENTQKDIETIAALASESADVTDIVTSEEWLISVEETTTSMSIKGM